MLECSWKPTQVCTDYATTDCLNQLLHTWHLITTLCVAAAAVEEDPSRHWRGKGGDLLLPSRWADSELKKRTIDNDSDPNGGRCLGIRCLMWDRCQVPSKMIHETFGGRSHESGIGSGWTAMSKATLLLGAQGFLGGMPLLKHLPVKISEFLHKVHSDKFSSFGLPRIQDPLRMDQIERLFQQIEIVDKDDAVIILHGGVLIGHKEHEGFQRVYAWSFPNKKFRDYNHQDAVFLRPEGEDRATFHPDPDNVWYGRCVLVFSFIVRSDANVRYRMKCALISTLEEYICPEDDAAAGDWCKKAETRRLFELDPSLPRLYVMPITSILGRVPLVRAGNTGTIPHHMRGRKGECFPGGKADSAAGKGDGSRLYFVNSWAMKWSQNP